MTSGGRMTCMPSAISLSPTTTTHASTPSSPFAISGLALEQFERYAPEVIESFQELAKTGSVEFLATPNGHSLASIYDEDEFVIQTKLQINKIKQLFGNMPTVYANTALVYSDEIGESIAKMGYKTIMIYITTVQTILTAF